MFDELKPFEFVISPPTRTTCRKCGDPLKGDTAGINCWCNTCKYLLRSPEPPYPRYSNIEPAKATMEALGLVPSFDERQAAELIPSGQHVEEWYDPSDEPAAKFDRLFRTALSEAA